MNQFVKKGVGLEKQELLKVSAVCVLLYDRAENCGTFCWRWCHGVPEEVGTQKNVSSCYDVHRYRLFIMLALLVPSIHVFFRFSMASNNFTTFGDAEKHRGRRLLRLVPQDIGHGLQNYQILQHLLDFWNIVIALEHCP